MTDINQEKPEKKFLCQFVDLKTGRRSMPFGVDVNTYRSAMDAVMSTLPEESYENIGLMVVTEHTENGTSVSTAPIMSPETFAKSMENMEKKAHG